MEVGMRVCQLQEGELGEGGGGGRRHRAPGQVGDTGSREEGETKT